MKSFINNNHKRRKGLFHVEQKGIGEMEQRSVDDIFDAFLSQDPFFMNRTALASNYVPDKIPHRQDLLAKMAQILAPALRLNRPSNLFVYGNTGTGKTLSLRHTMDKLNEHASRADTTLKTIYLNCKLKKTADTEYRLIAQILREFGQDVPITGLPTDELYRLFEQCLESRRQLVLLVLDEIDQLVKKCGDDILYTFTRLNTDLKNAQIAIVGISNDVTFINNLSPRVKSSLSEEELFFPSYNAIQIQDILRDRAALAFRKDSIDEGVIEKCAAFAARDHGDVRRAIELLRVAAELAERDGAARINLGHVDNAEGCLERERIIDIIEAQPKQTQATLYTIILLARASSSPLFTGDIYDGYKQLCERLALRPLTQRRVSDIIGELDMLGIISAKVTSKGRYGRTREISIHLSKDLVGKIVVYIEKEWGFCA